MPTEGQHARWYGSGAAVAGNSVPDPLNWLGARHASENPSDAVNETILTTRNNELRHVPIWGGRAADADNLTRKWWLVGNDQGNEGAVARVGGFDDTANEAKLEDLPPADWTAFQSTFRLYEPNQVFNAVTAAESYAGLVDYRCLYFQNHSLMGSSITGLRFWVDPLQACGCELALVPATATGEMGAGSLISDRFEDPLDSQGFSRFDASQFLTSNRWRQPLQNSSYDGVPHSALTMANGAILPIWFRRTVPAFRRKKVSAAFVVRWASTLTGGDPDPLSGAMVIAFDITGTDRDVTVVQDRKVHVDGGCRFEVSVDEDNGLGPIPNEPVTFSITSGTATEDGSLAGDNPDYTDAAGEASNVYLASTDPTDEGKTVTVGVSVPDGTEL